jgi:hypothetical protein
MKEIVTGLSMYIVLILKDFALFSLGLMLLPLVFLNNILSKKPVIRFKK